MAQLVATVATAATAVLSRASVTLSLTTEEKIVSPNAANLELEQYSPTKSKKNGFELSHRLFGESNPFFETWDDTISEVKQRANEEHDPNRKQEIEKLAKELEKGGKVCKNGIAVECVAEDTIRKIDVIKEHSNDPQLTEQLILLSSNVNTMRELSQENLKVAVENVANTYNELRGKHEPSMPKFEELWNETKKPLQELDLHPHYSNDNINNNINNNNNNTNNNNTDNINQIMERLIENECKDEKKDKQRERKEDKEEKRVTSIIEDDCKYTIVDERQGYTLLLKKESEKTPQAFACGVVLLLTFAFIVLKRLKNVSA